MKKGQNTLSERMRTLTKLLALVAFILVFWWLAFAKKDNHLGLDSNGQIGLTPTQIQSVKDIGEWEFLAINNEELVDTVRKGLFKDDQLVRIYYGTLRLGIDLSKAADGWIRSQGDSVVVTLPKVELLSHDFIDEARTKAFYESGKWSAADREALYRKAQRQMLAHCLTPQNLRSAQVNAEMQFRKMLKTMGFNHVSIQFEDETDKNKN